MAHVFSGKQGNISIESIADGQSFFPMLPKVACKRTSYLIRIYVNTRLLGPRIPHYCHRLRPAAPCPKDVYK